MTSSTLPLDWINIGTLTIPKPPPPYFHGITHPGRRFQEMRWDRRPFLSHMDKEVLGRFDPCGAAMWHGCPHDQQKAKIWKDCFKYVAPIYLRWTAISSQWQQHLVQHQNNKIKTKHTHTHYLYQMWKRQHVVTSVVGQKYVSHLAHVHLLPMRTCINWKRLHSQRHQTFHIGCCCPHSERLYMVVLHISMHHTRTEYLLNISNLTWIESHNSSTGA